jgi:hypothetical protein
MNWLMNEDLFIDALSDNVIVVTNMGRGCAQAIGICAIACI